MSDDSKGGDRNSILSGLPRDEAERLGALLRPVTLPAGSILDGDRRREEMYFVVNGYVSLMVELIDGARAEAGAIGNEGVLGISLAHQSGRERATAVVRVPTLAMMLTAIEFFGNIDQLPILESRLLRYAADLHAQAMHLAACNGHHGLLERLARCLLGIQDRTGSAIVPLGHETLAAMLCASRPSISVAIRQLERSALIEVATGSLRVVDRAGLEAASCQCHGMLRWRSW